MVVPLAFAGLGWHGALLILMVFPLLALFFWLPQSRRQAAALAGIAQAVGSLLAACGPPVMGKIHDSNGDWHIPLIAVALLSVAMAVFGALAGRDREING